MRWPWSDSADSRPEPGREGAASRPRASSSTSTDESVGDRRPVWLLDVDGVLNADRPGWGGDVADGWARAGHGRFWIRWSPAAVRRILEIDGTGAVEVRWATTWVPWIEQIEGLLGLPQWAVAWDGPHEGLGSPAIPTPLRKVQTALSVVEEERRPLVWTDDDVIPSHGPLHDRLVNAGVPCLLVSPSTRAGLQPDHLDAVEKFLRPFA